MRDMQSAVIPRENGCLRTQAGGVVKGDGPMADEAPLLY
jgi:hypothetical protein